MAIDLVNDHTIIRSQGDFDDLVTGDCTPTIDFTTYDLIIGKQGFSSGIDTTYHSFVQDCNDLSKTLTVTFVRNETDEAPNLTYHVLVPKLEDNMTLEVRIEIIPQELI